MFLQLPTLLLALSAALSLSWLAAWRRSPRPAHPAGQVASLEAADPTPAAPESPPASWAALRADILHWVSQNRVELAILALGVATGIIVLIIAYVAPSQAPHVPGMPGRPFFALRYVRDFLTRSGPRLPLVVAVLGALINAGLLVRAHARKIPAAASSGMLTAALGLATLGQLALGEDYPEVPLIPYSLAAFFFLIWAWMNRISPSPASGQTAAWTRQEIALLSVVMLVTMYARFYGLQSIPYGIEGDEGRWTTEVVQSLVAREFRGSTDYHLSSVPVSFYMQAPFHRLFGPGILSARLAVAFYSVLGSLAFYWLARQLFNVQVALLAAALLAVSIFDISASRLANVESHVKLWPLLALAMLVSAGRSGSVFSYLLAGLLIAVSCLTYDTLAPLAAVGLLLAVSEIARARISLGAAVRRLMAFLVPQLLVAPVVIAYLTGRSLYYDIARRWSGDLLGTLAQHAGELADSLFRFARPDFLYNRSGPLFNALLLPWLLLGIAVALVNWRRGRFAWVLVYAAAFYLPAPLLVNAPMGRVIYPALPAAYLLMALAMAAVWRSFAQALGLALRPLLFTAAGVGLAYLAFANLYLYFNEVVDPGDRLTRRELYETARAAASPGTKVFFPYAARANEPIEQEADLIIWLGLRAAADGPAAPDAYEVLPLESLMPALASVPPAFDRAEIVWDRSPRFMEARADTLVALHRCYRPLAAILGETFVRYTFERSALDGPICRSGTLRIEPVRAQLVAGQPLSIHWSLSGSGADSLELTCSTLRPDTVVVEAETMQGQGWIGLEGFLPGYEGAGFLADNPGSRSAEVEVLLPPGSPLYAWVRSFRRLADQYPGYLWIAGDSAPFAAEDSPEIGEWQWELVGEFDPEERRAVIQLERPYPEDAPTYLGLFVDSVVLTSSATLIPSQAALWSPTVDQNFSIPQGTADGSFALRLPVGMHRCALQARDPALVDPSGNPGLRSPTIEIIVMPNGS